MLVDVDTHTEKIFFFEIIDLEHDTNALRDTLRKISACQTISYTKKNPNKKISDNQIKEQRLCEQIFRLYNCLIDLCVFVNIELPGLRDYLIFFSLYKSTKLSSFSCVHKTLRNVNELNST